MFGSLHIESSSFKQHVASWKMLLLAEVKVNKIAVTRSKTGDVIVGLNFLA